MKIPTFSLVSASVALLMVACGGSDASAPPGSGGSGGGTATGGTGAVPAGTGATPATGGTGAAPANTTCTGAVQQLPAAPICDAAARVCLGVAIPSDEQACNECMATAPNVGQDPNAPLTQCSCQNCAIYLAACFDSVTWEGANGDAQRDQLCRAIVECGQTNGCQGTECYLNADFSPGPCTAQIDAAADASEDCSTKADQLTCVLDALANPLSAVMRASEVGACVQGDSTQMPAVVGNCQL